MHGYLDISNFFETVKVSFYIFMRILLTPHSLNNKQLFAQIVSHFRFYIFDENLGKHDREKLKNYAL